MNLYQRLRQGFGAALDQPFLDQPHRPSRTYREIERQAASFGAALLDAGASVGDRVVVQVDKSAEAVALYLGALMAGVVYVPLNTAYTEAELRFFLDDTGAAVHVTRPASAAELDLPATIAVLTLDGDGGGTLPELAERVAPLDAPIDREPDDLAIMIYTSGTTGRSKGAMLSHGAVISNGESLNQIWGFEPTDVLLHSLPIFHVHGLFVALHSAMLSGCRVLLLPRFEVDAVLAALPEASVLMGVPTHHTRLLADPRFDRQATAHMRLFTSGSAPMTEGVHAEFTDRTGHRILERYGMSEAGIITSNPLDGERIPGTVGFALPGFELRIADDEGTPLSVGETGALEIRGPGLFDGYWQLPERTASEHREGGWFVTGDIGRLDAEGRLSLEGRAGDMIISGGYNIYPKEIEMVLDEFDGVAETAVVGLPHPDFGECPAAFVVADAGSTLDLEDLARSLDGRLARFKHPKRLISIEALPRNTMGKVQKTRLRSDYVDLLK